MRVASTIHFVFPALAVVAVTACSDSISPVAPSGRAPMFASGGTGSGGGGGGSAPPPVVSPTPVPAPSGGTQLPPSPQVDGPAWFFAALGGVTAPITANINFDALQNLSPGGISVGTTRTA